MSKILDNDEITATQVCYLLNIHFRTLGMWYTYIQQTPPEKLPKDCPGLPPYRQDKPRGKRYWKVSDVHQLYRFQQWVPKGKAGVMGEVSRKYWSRKNRTNT